MSKHMRSRNQTRKDNLYIPKEFRRENTIARTRLSWPWLIIGFTIGCLSMAYLFRHHYQQFHQIVLVLFP